MGTCLQPAERCCFRRPLLEGVKLIATDTVVIGVFGVFSFFLNTVRKDHHSPAYASVVLLQSFANLFGLVAGCKGLMGVMARDPRRLRVLLAYHFAQLFVNCLLI